jgi:catechol 2,3-dioxygenase-like lactoylglutathione lyase family enzyme
MNTPRLSHLLETSLYVEDLDRAQHFYERVLGLECLLRDERMAGLGVPGGSVLLLFLRGASTEPTPTDNGHIPPHDARGAQHLCLAMPWGELAAWEQALAAAGVATESRVVWPRGGTSLYFRDPDGHSLEIATPGLWPTW